MDDLVRDVLVESGENLDRLDQELVQLESDPSSRDLLSSIFRTIHTIKGSCGFLGFARLEKLAHAGESLLSRLRDGKITLNAEITSGLLAMVDAVRRMLASIQASDHDGDEDYAPLIEQLAHLQEDQVAELCAESHGKSAETPPPAETVETPKSEMTSEPSPTLSTRKPRRNSKREKKLLSARDEAVALEHGEDRSSVGGSAS